MKQGQFSGAMYDVREIKVNGEWLEINGVAIHFPSDTAAQNFLLLLIKEVLA